MARTGRFHLGLLVPDDCGVQLGEVRLSWVEGEWLAFDDVQVHSTWNHSDRDRVVLSLDFEHPDLPVPRQAYASRFLLGNYYDFLRRSHRTRRTMIWFNEAVRRRVSPLGTTP